MFLAQTETSISSEHNVLNYFITCLGKNPGISFMNNKMQKSSSWALFYVFYITFVLCFYNVIVEFRQPFPSSKGNTTLVQYMENLVLLSVSGPKQLHI